MAGRGREGPEVCAGFALNSSTRTRSTSAFSHPCRRKCIDRAAGASTLTCGVPGSLVGVMSDWAEWSTPMAVLSSGALARVRRGFARHSNPWSAWTRWASAPLVRLMARYVDRRQREESAR
jgi:hypothetical protein